MNIRKSLRQSKQTSLPCNDSEQNTNLGVAMRISITRITWRFNATWSCHQGETSRNAYVSKRVVFIRSSTLSPYIQTPSTAICTSTQPEGDCCPTARSSTVSYIQKITDMCISTQSDGDCCLTGRSSTVSYIQTPSTGMCTSTQSDGDWCPTERSSTVSYIQTPSTDMCTFTQSDGDWCLTGRSSTVAYIQTPSTAICTSTQPDGDCYSTFRHLLLLCVLLLSLMVIIVLHSDTFYCYLYFL